MFTNNLADRVKWFRDWVDIERHEEEIEILGSEFSRAVKAHGKMERCWLNMEKGATGGGAKAFAARMAVAYKRLGERMSAKYAVAKGEA